MKDFITFLLIILVAAPMFLGVFIATYLAALLLGVLSVKIVTATAIYFNIEPTWLLFSLSITGLGVAISSSLARLKK